MRSKRVLLRDTDARDVGDIITVLPVMDLLFCDHPWQVCTLSPISGGTVALNDEVMMVTPQLLLELDDVQVGHVAAVRDWYSLFIHKFN